MNIAKTVAVVAFLSLPCSAGAGEEAPVLRARVAAGPFARRDTPVSLEVSLGRMPSGATVADERGNRWGQVEDLGGGKARIWWVLATMEAGEERTYGISLTYGAKAGGKRAFRWKDSSGTHGKSMDLMSGDSPVIRYMYTPFDSESIELTKKPFHHVFSPDGERLITKGPGGLYPHHRGLYFGYNRCSVPGVKGTLDTWHAHRGEHQVHVDVVEEIMGPVVAGHAVKIHWNDRQGKTFVEETRRVVVFSQARGAGDRLIEFSSTLKPTRGTVRLEGDRQHAGVQFRAAQYVADHQKETSFLRPEKWKHLPPNEQVNSKEHRDLPWNAIQFRIEDKPYTVAYLTDPENPDGADFSERLYGRFGEFFPWELREDNPLSVRYRWWIKSSDDVTREEVQAKYEDLAHPPEVKLLNS